jgi:hypothetical protein
MAGWTFQWPRIYRFARLKVDYLLTEFSNNKAGATQNNFRYMLGVNIGFGGK